MPFNGSGTFTRVHDWTTDAANSINNEASRQDAEDDGFAAGLSNCITKDGQTTVTADIPFNNKKLINVANGTNSTDVVTKGQLDSAIAGTAPLNASYVVLGANATLTGERILTAESGVLTLTDAGANGYITVGLAAGGVANSKLANMATATVKANITGAGAAPSDVTPTQILDLFGTQTQGLLVRGNSAWQFLAPGSNGQVLGISSGTLQYITPTSPASAATAAQQRTGSSTTVYVSPGTQRNHHSAIKAAVRFTDGPTTLNSYGVSGVTKLGTGAFRVTFSPAFTSAPIVIATANAAAIVSTRIHGITTTTADVYVSLIGGSPVNTDSFTDISLQACEAATS